MMPRVHSRHHDGRHSRQSPHSHGSTRSTWRRSSSSPPTATTSVEKQVAKARITPADGRPQRPKVSTGCHPGGCWHPCAAMRQHRASQRGHILWLLLLLFGAGAQWAAARVPTVKCGGEENICPPAGFYCPAAPEDARQQTGNFPGCGLCLCDASCACGSGCKLCSCGALCCDHSPVNVGAPNQCYIPCPPGLTSRGDGTDWDRCHKPVGRHWGTPLLVLLAVLGVAYVVGGAAWSRRTSSSDFHPHVARWRALRSLVVDGVAFARQRVRPAGSRLQPSTLSATVRQRLLQQQQSKTASDGDADKKSSKARRKTKRKSTQARCTKSSGSASGVGDAVAASVPPVTDDDGIAGSSDGSSRAVHSGAAGGGRWVRVT
jgi:hypothetical protein